MDFNCITCMTEVFKTFTLLLLILQTILSHVLLRDTMPTEASKQWEEKTEDKCDHPKNIIPEVNQLKAQSEQDKSLRWGRKQTFVFLNSQTICIVAIFIMSS